MQLQQKRREASLLFILTLFCFGLSIFRYEYTETKTFLFLNWNLFLAGIPWLLSSSIVMLCKIQKSNLGVIILLATWLLFFPNAPYILTDLFHLRTRTTIPIWYDLVLILAFAWTGLLYGFFSLRDIEQILAPKLNRSFLVLNTILLLFLSSFGIYIGRFLRWNSWDILQSPIALFYDIGDRFLHPLDYPSTWGMTVVMWLLLNMMYWSFRFMDKTKAA